MHDTLDHLTAEEVAARLRVHPQTVGRWAKLGLIPAVKVGRQWRYPARELDAHLAAARQSGQPAFPSVPHEGVPHRPTTQKGGT